MSSRPRFGQGSPVKVYVPISVIAGESFPLKAVRFDPKVRVKIDIATPRRRSFLEVEGKSFEKSSDENGNPIRSDQSGNISTSIDTQGLEPGTYTVTITGKSNGQEVAAEAFLNVLDPQTDTID